MKLKKKEQITLVENAIKKCKEFSNNFEGLSNPQVIKMKSHLDGQIEAFEAVIDMFNGNNVSIKIMAQ